MTQKQKTEDLSDVKISRRDALIELALRKARRKLSTFILYNHSDYKMGWFHKEVCDALDEFKQDVLDRKSPRLILCAPPRHGKSQIVSRDFPAQFLGENPDLSIIACSYSSDLASRMNRDVQRIMDSMAYADLFPQVLLASKEAIAVTGDTGTYSRTSDLFEIVGHKGSYRSAGVGGGITGQGCDILIIDDPHKDKQEAYSATYRERVWDWYTSTAYTRLSPGGGVIVMCTRWHTSDLVGKLIEESANGGDVFKVINYPAIAEHDEGHRKAGEALHEERFPLDALEKIRAAVGSRDWASMYQQHPLPEGGGVFKKDWIQYYETLPAHFDKVVLSWDMTFKDSDSSDYVVGACWGRCGADYYLIDQVRGRWDFVETVHKFCDFSNTHNKVLRKLIEDKANGSAVISTLKKHVSGIVPIVPAESKESRANAVATLFESHNVYIPRVDLKPWARDFESELLTFPAGSHDDQVDAMTQALTDLRTGGRISADNIMALRGLYGRR